MLTLTVLVLTIGCAIASAIEQKIIGGHHAEDGQFPYQVSLRLVSENNEHTCGGSIISPQWILSAAHCFIKEPSDIFAVVGSIYLNRGGERYNIINVINHEDYYIDETTVIYDISVLKTNGNIKLGNAVKTIRLATAVPPSGVKLTLAGWGLTSYYKNQPPNHLQYVTLKSLTVDQCQAILPEYIIYDSHQCAISPDGQGFCKGDSGGPLVYGSQQVGIVSWFADGCGSEAPDVFTSVAAYRNWIKDATGV